MARLEHIGLDVDGVLRDLPGALVARALQFHPELEGQIVPLERWESFYAFQSYFPATFSLGEFMRVHFRALWEEAPAYPGAVEAVTTLLAHRTVHIVTAQPTPKAAELTRRWLHGVGISIPEARFHVTAAKQDAPVQVLVDDLTVNLEAVGLAGIVPICMRQPWNAEYEGFSIARLTELESVLERLESSGG